MCYSAVCVKLVCVFSMATDVQWLGFLPGSSDENFVL